MSYINTETDQYPVSQQEIQALHPETSFPVPFSPPAPFVFVFAYPRPTFNPITEYVIEVPPAQTPKGNWEQRWSVQQFDAETAAANQAAEVVRLMGSYEGVIQNHLDDAAKVDNYDSIMTAISYASEPIVEKFQKDGIRYRKWRSLVWDYTYKQLALVVGGQRTMPTQAEFLDEIPALEAPI